MADFKLDGRFVKQLPLSWDQAKETVQELKGLESSKQTTEGAAERTIKAYSGLLNATDDVPFPDYLKKALDRARGEGVLTSGLQKAHSSTEQVHQELEDLKPNLEAANLLSTLGEMMNIWSSDQVELSVFEAVVKSTSNSIDKLVALLGRVEESILIPEFKGLKITVLHKLKDALQSEAVRLAIENLDGGDPKSIAQLMVFAGSLHDATGNLQFLSGIFEAVARLPRDAVEEALVQLSNGQFADHRFNTEVFSSLEGSPRLKRVLAALWPSTRHQDAPDPELQAQEAALLQHCFDVRGQEALGYPGMNKIDARQILGALEGWCTPEMARRVARGYCRMPRRDPDPEGTRALAKFLLEAIPGEEKGENPFALGLANLKNYLSEANGSQD